MIDIKRLEWMDKVKSLMTIMVISVHAAVTYGSEGGWYYQEPTENMVSVVILTLQNAVFQSFFMSLFFFISGYFIPVSLERKGKGKFILDRLARLGLPCLAFLFALGPLTIWITDTKLESLDFIYRDSIHIGPMWFAQALLIFTAAYLLIRQLSTLRPSCRPALAAVGKRPIYLLFAVLALTTFLARWAWPMGYGIWGMQLGSFPQYIALFSLGILSRQRGWLHDLDKLSIRKLAGTAFSGILLMPILMLFGEDPELGLTPFMGGFFWQAGVYAIWESGMCVVMSLLILAAYSGRNRPHTSLSREFSASAYTIYIIHPAILLVITVFLAQWIAYPLVKFASLLFLGTVISFLIAMPSRRIPGLRKIL